MLRFVTIACLLAGAALAQNVDPKNAKILKEQRFNAGDGRAGSAFATEDGHVFREETNASGDRIGQYSYIGDDGQTYTVMYSAGKDGFRILSGDHVPSSGQGAANFVNDPDTLDQAPQPQAALPAPLPVQRAALAQEQQFVDYDDAPVDPNFNPFINPNDPTHLNFNFNKNAAQFAPGSPLARSSNLVPDCADCAGVNPFVNPFDASHQSGGVLAGHLAGFGAGQQQQQRAALPVARPAPSPAAALPRVALPDPTNVPKRFFPPGQLSLERFPTGFNFDFES